MLQLLGSPWLNYCRGCLLQLLGTLWFNYCRGCLVQLLGLPSPNYWPTQPAPFNSTHTPSLSPLSYFQSYYDVIALPSWRQPYSNFLGCPGLTTGTAGVAMLQLLGLPSPNYRPTQCAPFNTTHTPTSSPLQPKVEKCRDAKSPTFEDYL